MVSFLALTAHKSKVRSVLGFILARHKSCNSFSIILLINKG